MQKMTSMQYVMGSAILNDVLEGPPHLRWAEGRSMPDSGKSCDRSCLRLLLPIHHKLLLSTETP